MTSRDAARSAAREWQYCRLEASTLWGDEEGISDSGWAYGGRCSYTPFGPARHPLTEKNTADPYDDFDYYNQKELERSRLLYPRLFEQLAKLGLDGWELFQVTRRHEVEGWVNQEFWFRRPVANSR